MKRRASLAMLMGLVAILAVGLASMKVATAQCSRAAFGLGLLALLVGTLGALVRSQGRAQWIGFTLFGWAYVLVLLVPPFREVVAVELPGNELPSDLADFIHPPLAYPVEPPGQPPSTQLEKHDAGRYHYWENGQIVDLGAQERKPWAIYLDRLNAYDARDEAAGQARRIALIFLGLAFAVLGAAFGMILEGPSRPIGTPPAAPTLDRPI